MTMASGGDRVLPELWDIFLEETAGIVVDPAALRLIEELLAQGTAALTGPAASLAESGQQGDDLTDAKAQLREAFRSAVEELRQRDMGSLDHRTTALLMQARCPLPPFCYGTDAPATIARGSAAPATATPVPAG